ncbi:hypothetical protein T09_14679 [Trichinella sp. T9]|nr:hypothetical protein T09_14679 [Trichinella sp. T9]
MNVHIAASLFSRSSVMLRRLDEWRKSVGLRTPSGNNRLGAMQENQALARFGRRYSFTRCPSNFLMGLNLTDRNREFTLSQHCNTSRQESWKDFESGKAKASILLRTAYERRMLLRHPATRNCSAFEAAVLSFHSVIRFKESSNGRY